MAYAERGARQLTATQDLGAFQRFLKLTAARTGQLLHVQSLASDTGVSDKTAKQWLSILETCYLIHFVCPHFANFGKRLTKSPKIYMTDVGPATALLGIHTALQMQSHPLRGALFETMVVNEFLKSRANSGVGEPLCFWRDNIGAEADLILERGQVMAAVEIKSGITAASDAFNNLEKWQKHAVERWHFSDIYPGLVYGGDVRFPRAGVDVLPSGLL